MIKDNKTAFAKAEMLIRKPVAEVFNAFINPDVTTQFWFTKSTGVLEAGKQIEWIWEMYNITVHVKVLDIQPDKRIFIEWDNAGTKATVEWSFNALTETTTFVSVINDGFSGDTDKIISLVRDSTEGFTITLAGLKALLEYNIKLNLVADRFPEGL